MRVPGCQPALRPPPSSGYFCIENNHETTAVWDAATGHAWHISSDHQPRSLDDHHEHLLHLNGDHVDPADTEHTPLVHPGDLELPTLHQLKLLAGDCAALFSELGGVGGTPSSEQKCLHTLCTELWPDPASPDNCAGSATRDATRPETHAHEVSLTDTYPLDTRNTGHAHLPDVNKSENGREGQPAAASTSDSRTAPFEEFAEAIRHGPSIFPADVVAFYCSIPVESITNQYFLYSA